MSESIVCQICGKSFDITRSERGDVCHDCELLELGMCNFCGASPASGYTSSTYPHETIYCCDDCFEYEKGRFDGFSFD